MLQKLVNYIKLFINRIWPAYFKPKEISGSAWIIENKERLKEIFNMAAPHKKRFLQGEVLFKNIDKETVQIIKAYLDKLESGQPDEPEKVVPLPAPQGVMPDTAVGISRESSGQYSICVLKYNHSSKEAIVEEIIPAGDNKAIATGKLKVVIFEKGII